MPIDVLTLINQTLFNTAGPSGRAVWGVGLRPLAYWDRGFESHRGHGCFSVCVLPGRGLCDRLITRPEESYKLWRVVVCDQETSNTRRLNTATGQWKIQPQWAVTPRKQITNCLTVVHKMMYLVFTRHRSVVLRKCDVTSFSLRAWN